MIQPTERDREMAEKLVSDIWRIEAKSVWVSKLASALAQTRARQLCDELNKRDSK